MDERTTLKQRIHALDFALLELNLFLDTHPENGEALAEYVALRKKREALLEEYRMNVGPIPSYSAGGRNGWNWVEGPWPWEKEA